MQVSSIRTWSHLARLALASLAVLGVTAFIRPAQAVVDPASGQYQFALYKNANCEGSTVASSGVGSSAIRTADLSTLGFNDMASSWSFCNDTTDTYSVTVRLYTNSNYGGTEIVPANSVAVPAGLCITGNNISPNDAVSSIVVNIIKN